jgi:hypothetical protein
MILYTIHLVNRQIATKHATFAKDIKLMVVNQNNVKYGGLGLTLSPQVYRNGKVIMRS